jgi:hypothetical protein
MLGGKVGCRALGLAVDDEVGAALPVQHHILGSVLGDPCEAQLFEQRFQYVGSG